MQKTSLEFTLTPEEANRYNRAIHRVIHLMNELPPLTTGAFDQTVLRADLLKLAMALDNGTPLMTSWSAPQGGPLGGGPDPFVPEGDGSARDVLLGRLVENQGQVLGYLEQCARGRPEDARRWSLAAHELAEAWSEYEDLGRG